MDIVSNKDQAGIQFSTSESFLREFNHCRFCFKLQITFNLLKIQFPVFKLYAKIFQILKPVNIKQCFAVSISAGLNFPVELEQSRRNSWDNKQKYWSYLEPLEKNMLLKMWKDFLKLLLQLKNNIQGILLHFWPNIRPYTTEEENLPTS